MIALNYGRKIMLVLGIIVAIYEVWLMILTQFFTTSVSGGLVYTTDVIHWDIFRYDVIEAMNIALIVYAVMGVLLVTAFIRKKCMRD